MKLKLIRLLTHQHPKPWLLKRLLSSAPRVRFAPSPTGELHVGGLRTALINYLFARKHDGTFILRIEDTDRARFIESATGQLIDTLEWAGLKIDEGPTSGGQLGPYVQSERKSIYAKCANELVEKGFAYRCFCTAKRLDLLRKDCAKMKQPFKYDNRCRNLPSSKLTELLTNQTPFTIRLKLDTSPFPWHDLIYGEMSHNVASSEGDPIVLKSDGYPTYHLANVVDDHYMQITHILRGSEWLTSTPKHLMLYKYFDWTPPAIGHLPLIVNPDGKKLSKRERSVTVEHFRNLGYRNEAVVNLVTTSTDDSEYRTLDEMIDTFDLHALRHNPMRLNLNNINKFNRYHLEKAFDNEKTEMIRTVRKLMETKFGAQNLHGDLFSDDFIAKIIRWSFPRIGRLEDLVEDQDLQFIWSVPAEADIKNIEPNIALGILEKAIPFVSGLSEDEFVSRRDVEVKLRLFCEQNCLKWPQVTRTLMTLMTGLKTGPPVAEMMSILGKANSLERLKNAKLFLS